MPKTEGKKPRRQSLSKKPKLPPVVSLDSDDDNEEIFEVETILDKRILAGLVCICVCPCDRVRARIGVWV